LNNGPEIIAYLYRTADGGKSFTRLTEIRSGRPYVTGLVFTGENTGWLTTDHGAGPVAGGIAGTVDGGRTFMYIVGGDGGIDDIGAVDYIAFPSAKTGFAVCSGIEESSCLLKTEDGGKAWRQISPVKPRNGISFPDKYNGFGIGTDFTANRVLRTQDGGATWNPITVPDTGSAPVGLSFIDRRTGFILCNYYTVTDTNDVLSGVTLYKTADAGTAWAKVSDVGGSLPRYGSPSYFRMFDERNGVISWLSEGALWFDKTDDGGVTWVQSAQYAFQAGEFGICSFSSPDKGIIYVCDGKHLSIAQYKSGFISQPAEIDTPVSEWISWIACANAGNRTVALYSGYNTSTGAQNAFAISDDNGAAWQSAPAAPELNDILTNVTDNYNVGGFSFSDGNDGFLIIPGYSSLLVTTDGGHAWQWR